MSIYKEPGRWKKEVELQNNYPRGATIFFEKFIKR